MDEKRNRDTPDTAAEEWPGEPDTPKQAHDETAANVRALRKGDTVPQRD